MNPHAGRMIRWKQVEEERYCVDSGRPVRLIPGDRCRAHGARDVMCTTAVRSPRCLHAHLCPNHPDPYCSECGNTGGYVCGERVVVPPEEHGDAGTVWYCLRVPEHHGEHLPYPSPLDLTWTQEELDAARDRARAKFALLEPYIE